MIDQTIDSEGCKLLSVCLFEQAQGFFYVVGMLPQRFRVPLAPFGSKEITSVNVYGAGQAWNGVGHRVNDVRSKRLCIFFAKRSRTRRLDLASRKPTPKNVVLAARVYANDGPHLVVVGPDRHSWPPDDIENGEVRRMINFLHTRALRLA